MLANPVGDERLFHTDEALNLSEGEHDDPRRVCRHLDVGRPQRQHDRVGKLDHPGAQIETVRKPVIKSLLGEPAGTSTELQPDRALPGLLETPPVRAGDPNPSTRT